MIRRFISYYKPHRRLFMIDFTSALIVALLELAFPVAVQWFIDTLLPGGNWNIIILTSVGLLLIYSLSTFLHYIVDRKSTRLNSSHVAISYAVFCLKKKKRKYD